jgi:ribosomal protein S27AE
MTDPQEPRKELTDEAAADYFRGLLQKRGIETPSCPACGAKNWGGFADLALTVITDRHITDPGPKITGAAHALLASCGKCGFMSMFDRDVIGD